MEIIISTETQQAGQHNTCLAKQNVVMATIVSLALQQRILKLS
jgi:hypothetical protein